MVINPDIPSEFLEKKGEEEKPKEIPKTKADDFPDLQARRKLKAEWIVAQSILGEIVIINFSKESYDKYSVTDFFAGMDGKCRISWETWKRYYSDPKNIEANILGFGISKENLGLKPPKEYRDTDGKTHQIEKPIADLAATDIFSTEGQVNYFYELQLILHFPSIPSKKPLRD